MTCVVPIPRKLIISIKDKLKVEQNNKTIITDYRQQPLPLFWHNNTLYYGNRDFVFNSILFLKESKDFLDFNEIFTLSGSLDYSLINMYIDSLYTGKINLMLIEPKNIIEFLSFIDQYPTESLSINKLEQEIVDLFEQNVPSEETNKISFSSKLEEMCEKYKLKSLYLLIHNEKYRLSV